MKLGKSFSPHPERRFQLLWPLMRQWIRRGPGTLVIGPWRSEVGFEALYWIPFLRQTLAGLAENGRRILITRGGAHSWYPVSAEPLAGATWARTRDVYDYRTLEQIRLETARQQAQTGLVKQLGWSAWERALVKEMVANARAEGETFRFLHPSWMYQLCRPWWEGRMGLAGLTRLCDFTPLARGPRPVLPFELPADYIAMRFYSRASTFPHQDSVTVQAARAIAREVSRQMPVILLDQDVHADEHLDVVRLTHLATGQSLQGHTTILNNLSLQGAVIAHAKAFIGTYGGLAQLALRYRVPSLSFYRQWGGTAMQHLHLSDWLAKMTRTPFYVLALEDLNLVRSMLPVFVGKLSSRAEPWSIGRNVAAQTLQK